MERWQVRRFEGSKDGRKDGRMDGKDGRKDGEDGRKEGGDGKEGKDAPWGSPIASGWSLSSTN